MNQAAKERFWAKVNQGGPDDCWEWTAARTPRNYGAFTVREGPDRRTSYRAHRLAYELVVGPISEGLCLDHLCRNRACCNPAHLEAVTPGENVLRGESLWAMNARKTHCANGHEFTPENTYYSAKGSRACRECRREAGRRYRAKRKAT